MVKSGFSCSDKPQFRQILVSTVSPIRFEITKALVIIERLILILQFGILL